MGDASKNRWIILINKTPRDPLTIDDIQVLLSQVVVRLNDIAIAVRPQGSSEKENWKFLWQFPEFDRRINEHLNPPPAAVLEKRQPVKEVDVQKKLETEVPLDLQQIRLEDLVVKAGGSVKRDTSAAKAEKDFEARREAMEEESNANAPSFSRFLYAGVGVLFLVAGGFFFFTSSPDASHKEKSDSVQAPVAVAPSSQAGPQAIRPGIPTLSRGKSDSASSRAPAAQRPNLSLPALNTKSPAPVPVERDRGEIRAEDAKRKREEQLERDRLEEEKRDVDSEDDASPADEDKPKSKKKDSKPSRHNEDSEEESAVPEEPAE